MSYEAPKHEPTRRAVIGTAVAVAATTALPLKTAIAGDPIRPARLTADHLTDPIGIAAAKPVLGWQLVAGGTDRFQSAYRILVATDPLLIARGRPDVWDSGRVQSSEQAARVYGGPPLRSRTRYHWAVRVWDEDGRPGPLSPTAFFETALDPDDWVAEWIGTGLEIPPPVRLLPPGQALRFALEPGHTIGERFTSAGPVLAVHAMLGVGPGETAGCTITLRRGGPDGAVVGTETLTGLTGDKYAQDLARLELADPAPAGTYYLELSAPAGTVSWIGMRHDGEDPYPDAAALADGAELDGLDRWLCTIAPDPPANPLLRTELTVDGTVAEARLYLSGLGHGVAWMNGRRVGDAVLSPVATDYDKRVLYSAYDVTELVRHGRNAIGVALGRGFFATRAQETDGSNVAPWVAEPQLKAQLEVVLTDGRRLTVGTGPDWRLTEGPVTFDSVFGGESYDARRAVRLDGWTEPGYDADGWRAPVVVPAPSGRLEAYPGEHLRTGDPVRPVSVRRLPDGTRLYDFGTVMAGWARLRGRFRSGETVRILYGEKLIGERIDPGVPGGFDNPAIDGRLQVDEFIATGRGTETWQPSLSYKGFRYAEVSGPDADLVAVPVHSDLADTLDLELGNPDLQWIADAFRQTAINGLHGYPDLSAYTRRGWLGAARNAVHPMLYQFGTARLFAHWLDDIRAAQLPTGEIPAIAPLSNGPFSTPVYASLYPHLLHRYWVMYGDPVLPARHFDALRRYVDSTVTMVAERLPDDQFGDWYPPGIAVGQYPRGPEGGVLVATAFVIQALRDAAAVASALERTTEARSWTMAADSLMSRFNEAFLDRTAGIYRTAEPAGYRQASNAIPLALGLVPAAYAERVAAGLAADVETRGRHLNTGSMGTGALPFALSDHGRADLAVSVLGQRSYPSYGYLRELGATTFWESWERHSRSHNDTTTGAPVVWLVERAAGLEPLAPGWSRFRVAPRPVPGLPGARIALDTVRGRIEVRWVRRGSRVVVDVRVPVNAKAELDLPDGRVVELGSGSHRIQSAY